MDRILVDADSDFGGVVDPVILQWEAAVDPMWAEGKVLGRSTGLALGIFLKFYFLMEMMVFRGKWEGPQIVGHAVAWKSLATASECR